MPSSADFFPWLICPAEEAFQENAMDARLAAAAGGGDAEAFRLLVEKHGAGLQGFCARVLGCSEEARDAAQEAFVRIWCCLRDGERRYEERGKFRAWLWRVALNLCRDRLRARSAHRRRLAAWEESASLDARVDCPAEAAARRADLQRLAEGLEALPEKLRLPLILSCMENLSHAECAAVLEITPRAVEGRVRRARERLLEWWNREN